MKQPLDTVKDWSCLWLNDRPRDSCKINVIEHLNDGFVNIVSNIKLKI